jgi:UDP:flavonoid glycosyltransferase YjiC (YdhE family)
MLIVPYGWDQPDNAARVQRLGAGLHIARSDYSVEKATAALKLLLDNSRFSIRAAVVRERMAAEDGLKSACDAIESVFGFSDSQPQQRSLHAHDGPEPLPALASVT